MKARRLWLASLVMLGGAAGEKDAWAEDRHPPVVVALQECEPALEAEVRRIVEVELKATVIPTAKAGNVVTRVKATCRGSEVELGLTDARTEKHLDRTVALAEAAATARARLLALAVAELVVTSWQEIQSAPQPVPSSLPKSQSPATDPAPAPASEERTVAMAEVLGVARTFPESRLWLLGAGARGLLTLSRPFTLAIELDAEWGKASRTGGQVAARALGGALSLGWGVEKTWVLVMPWVGARAGLVRLKGEPSSSSTTSGQTLSGPCLGPEAGIAASLFPRAVIHPTLAFSAGIMVLGVRGDVAGDSHVKTSGAWIAITIGVGPSWVRRSP
jgi:hypothetical protein